MMVTEVNAVEFGANAERLLSQVQSRRDSIVISKDGEPVAALVDAQLYRRLLWQHFDELMDPIRAAFRDVPEEIGTAVIDEAVRAVRHSR